MQEYTKARYLRLVYLLYFLLLGLISNAQNTGAPLSLKERFFQADSVQIISHEDLIFDIDTIPGKMGTHEIREIIKGGIINRSIVRESIMLSQQSIEKLFAILVYEGNKDYPRLACRIDPHHAILIYKNGLCFCIDVCFTCGGYVLSEPLPKMSLLANAEAGSQLYEFFKEKSIVYKLPERNGCSYCMAADYNKKTKQKNGN